jgi:hypothetical protein
VTMIDMTVTMIDMTVTMIDMTVTMIDMTVTMIDMTLTLTVGRHNQVAREQDEGHGRSGRARAGPPRM